MVTVYYVLWSNAFFFGTDGDGHSVFIRTSDKDHIFFFQTQVAYVDVSRDIDSCQMADVYRSVGIRQSRSDGCSLEFFFHICIVIVLSHYLSPLQR